MTLALVSRRREDKLGNVTGLAKSLSGVREVTIKNNLEETHTLLPGSRHNANEIDTATFEAEVQGQGQKSVPRSA